MDKITIWGQTINLFLGTRRVAIFDFDGTLSDGSGRLHLLPTKDLHLTEAGPSLTARQYLTTLSKARSM